jgi:2-phosphoglycerate kinase
MQEKRTMEIAEMLRKCLAFSMEQKEQMKREWWKEINEMKRNRPLDRYWAHFDFDMFYIAC